MSTELRMFLIAIAGSVAIESLNIVRSYESGKPLPVRYRRIGYWISRIILACMAGVMASATGNQNGYLAFYIGVSFPAFLENASHNPPEPK